jgi:RNA polymerase sigma factor (sigma-70 family)
MVDKEQALYDFINGDLDNFYTIMYSPLIAYAVRYLGDNYSFLAEDCVQDAVESAYNKRDDFEFSWQLNSYIFTCVHNNCISLIRKSKRQINLQEQENSSDEEISAGMIEQETIDMLHRAINELPEKYRQIFELNYNQGLKMKEVADALDITFETLKKRKAKMFTLLREQFKGNKAMQALLFILAMC